MSHYFLDSSALVKQYINETGTNWLRTLSAPSAGNTIIIARITQAEVISAISRRKRESSITSSTARAIRLLLEQHCAREYLITELTPFITTLSMDLLERHPLRAYDAVQLATALESNARLIAAGLPSLIFLSADNRLLNVAKTAGLTVDNPNNYP